MRFLRWLRCHVLSLHRTAEGDWAPYTCQDCDYWESDDYNREKFEWWRDK